MVEEARVKAEVKSAHMRALKARLREKKNWFVAESALAAVFLNKMRVE